MWVAVVFAVVAIGLQITWQVYDHRFQKSVQVHEEKNAQALKAVLESGNVELCEQYDQQPLKCVVLLGQQNDDLVCEKWYELNGETEEWKIIGCKAAVHNDEKYCERIKEKTYVGYCTSIIAMMDG